MSSAPEASNANAGPEREAEPVNEGKRSGRTKLVVVVIATVAITLAGVWVVTTYIYPRAFNPVELSAQERVDLERKLDQLGLGGVSASTSASDSTELLEPVRYQEDDAQREISFSEKELNGLLANNTNLASRLAIDLSDDLASARLLIPMEDDFPVVGGKTVRIDAGLEISFEDDRLVAVLRGVSVMGVPVPNAWLGNLRNVDLVQEFGNDPGFWRSFAAGIESLEVSDGELKLQLKE